MSSLRTYLEKMPLPSNGNCPLNPWNDSLSMAKPYMIICTHCHYDHILGIPGFIASNTSFVASSHSKSFITDDLPTTSLCGSMNVRTPEYTITHWADHLSFLRHPITSSSLRIQVLHVPGHTPDSLAWYDIEEHFLYVGDTFYERKRDPAQFRNLPTYPDLPENTGDIMFPEHGDWIAYMASLHLLLSFVQHSNETLKHHADGEGIECHRVLVAAGHLTASADAEAMIEEVQDLFWDIIYGRLAVLESFEKRGVLFDRWLRADDKFGVTAPRHIVHEAQNHFQKKQDSRK
jgi:hypothetical protein